DPPQTASTTAPRATASVRASRFLSRRSAAASTCWRSSPPPMKYRSCAPRAGETPSRDSSTCTSMPRHWARCTSAMRFPRSPYRLRRSGYMWQIRSSMHSTSQLENAERTAQNADGNGSPVSSSFCVLHAAFCVLQMPSHLLFPEPLHQPSLLQDLSQLQHRRVGRQHIDRLAVACRPQRGVPGAAEVAIDGHDGAGYPGMFEAQGHVVCPHAADHQAPDVAGQHLEVHVPQP